MTENMKRVMTSAVLATAATLMLTSCSKVTEVPEPAGGCGKIAFTPFVANSLRAGEFDLPALEGTGFTVSAFGNGATFFANKTVKKEATGGLWAPEGGDILWPGFELDFVAYANLGDYATPTIEQTGSKLELTTPTEVAKQTDVIIARDKGNSAAHGTNGVPLNFKHVLSQVEVKAVNTNTTPDYKIKVAGVKIGRIVKKATFKYPADTKTATTLSDYTLGTEKETFAAAMEGAKELSATAVSLMGTDGNFMLIPQTLTKWDAAKHRTEGTDNEGVYLSVLLNITTKEGVNIYPTDGKYAWAATPLEIAGGLEPGKKYVITLDFKDGAGYQDPEMGKPSGFTPATGVEISDNPVSPATSKPGTPILSKQVVKFTVTVEEWKNSDKSLEMPKE